MLLKEDATRARARRSTAGRGDDIFMELDGARRVMSAMHRELYFYLHYYFATLCAPASIIVLFVCYLFLKDRHRRL